MGTRADFYVGRGANATWLGSIGWDGYPDGISSSILEAQTDADYRAALVSFAAERNDWTDPDRDGWPWPWNDSRTTDYAYTFDNGIVYTSCFGRPYVDVQAYTGFDEDEDQAYHEQGSIEVFPDMRALKNVTFGKRSGLMVIGVRRGRDS